MILFLFLPLELLLGPDHNLKTCSAILHFLTSKSHNFQLSETHTILFFLECVSPDSVDRAIGLRHNQRWWGRFVPNQNPHLSRYCTRGVTVYSSLSKNNEQATHSLMKRGWGQASTKKGNHRLSQFGMQSPPLLKTLLFYLPFLTA